VFIGVGLFAIGYGLARTSAVSVAIFNWAENRAKRLGLLKRSG